MSTRTCARVIAPILAAAALVWMGVGGAMTARVALAQQPTTDAQLLSRTQPTIRSVSASLGDVLSTIARWQSGLPPTSDDLTILKKIDFESTFAPAKLLVAGTNLRNINQVVAITEEISFVVDAQHIMDDAVIAAEDYLNGDVSGYYYAIKNALPIHMSDETTDRQLLQESIIKLQKR